MFVFEFDLFFVVGFLDVILYFVRDFFGASCLDVFY